MTRGRVLILVGVAIALAACAGHKPRRDAGPSSASGPRSGRLPAETARPQSERYSQNDDNGPAAPPIDVSKIPEPVPKDEPRSRYGNKETYSVLGQTYRVLSDGSGYVERGIASWYGNKFHGYMTSSFEPYDMYAFTAAHKTLPLPSYARVTNLDNGKSVVVRVNDRGPFHENRIIDLSYAAAVKIGVWPKGTGLVEVRAIDPAHPDAPLPATRTAAVPAALPRAAAPAREVAVQAPAPVSAPAPDSGGAPRIYLQLGAFGERGNAERAAASAARAGLDHVDIQSIAVAGRTVHRVRVGPLADVDAADALTARIEKLGLGAPRVAIEH
ncbi:septal ring lytic transglycosylase RlpA family protein [Dokdonella soli]|uniref:Endolytic peptidoglycan transglycosylase RlpA n=1 Tax=Dokdonella soli TaxID=529810 RepID=A0ABN1ILH9_9GAMM